MTTTKARAPLDYATQKAIVIDVFKRWFVLNVMTVASGNVSEAARLAGLDRANFTRLVRQTRAAHPTLSRPCQDRQTRRAAKRRSGCATGEGGRREPR